MIQAASAQQRPIYEAPKARQKYSGAPRLFYPKDAMPLRTPFRVSVVQEIYELAHRELGDSLKSVDITTWHGYDEGDLPTLLLTFWTDADQSMRLQVEKTVIDSIANTANLWSEMQKKDYAETIYFGLEPI